MFNISMGLANRIQADYFHVFWKLFYTEIGIKKTCFMFLPWLYSISQVALKKQENSVLASDMLLVNILDIFCLEYFQLHWLLHFSKVPPGIEMLMAVMMKVIITMNCVLVWLVNRVFISCYYPLGLSKSVDQLPKSAL